MAQEDRYRLRAFVGSNGDVHHETDMGFSTFGQIYVRRPDKCRYAVAETVDGNFLAWDLYEAGQSTDGLSVYPPEEASHYTDVDQAIMATAMLAEEPE
jgi:hypothetical protein